MLQSSSVLDQAFDSVAVLTLITVKEQHLSFSTVWIISRVAIKREHGRKTSSFTVSVPLMPADAGESHIHINRKWIVE